MNKTDLLSAAQVATELGISRATLNRWAADGRIVAAVQMPGQTGARLFTRAEVERVKDGAAA